MISCCRNLKLRQTHCFVGLHAKEFNISVSCVEMLRYVRWGNPFLVCKTCHRVHSHFSTAGKFHYVWKKSCPKTNDLLERRNEHVIDSFLACLWKNHLASKLLKSWVKSKKETNALLQILLEKKHELQIRQKQIQGQWTNRACFQFQLNKNEASQKWKQCYSKYLEVVQVLFCNYFQKFRLHEGNCFANA